KEVENVIHSDNDFATVAFLRVKDAYLEPKAEMTALALSIPPLLEEGSLEVQEKVLQIQNHTSTSSPQVIDPPPESELRTLERKIGQWTAVSNVQVKVSEERLASQGITLAHSVNINLFLSSMDYFPRVNVIYSSFFGTSPPARACVAVDLPAGVRVRLDCVAIEEWSGTAGQEIRRQSLHVQSQSYWAPANIGPYSQAIV
ncbi:hypothetical protein V5O48_019374, partial [Marasmius crinis-equi]